MVTPGEYLDLLDARLPGLVVGAHVYGSRVLDDVVSDSDLDIVLELSSVTRGPRVTMPASWPEVDGADVAVVLAGDLEKPVAEVTPLVGEITPVLWQQLRTVGQTVRGTRPTCPVTAAEVEAYCRDNLRTYWRSKIEYVRRALTNIDQRKPVFREGLLWIGLGPARLWHTIRTGEIVSKSRAGELAAAQWPDLAPLILDMVANRQGADVLLTTDHMTASFELGDRILASL